MRSQGGTDDSRHAVKRLQSDRQCAPVSMRDGVEALPRLGMTLAASIKKGAHIFPVVHEGAGGNCACVVLPPRLYPPAPATICQPQTAAATRLRALRGTIASARTASAVGGTGAAESVAAAGVSGGLSDRRTTSAPRRGINSDSSAGGHWRERWEMTGKGAHMGREKERGGGGTG